MIAIFGLISIIVLVLYHREHQKVKRMEETYTYINDRLASIVTKENESYILMPCDLSIAQNTMTQVNQLLDQMRAQQRIAQSQQEAMLQIFTNLSHDLRTPITVLKGYIEMLHLQSQKETLPFPTQTLIQTIHQQAIALIHSMNHFFQLAKLQSHDLHLELQSTSMNALCKEVMMQYFDLLEQEEIHVELNLCETVLYANVDPDAIKRILQNLIENAISYGKSGKYLGLSLEKQNDMIAITIEDHGKGITEEQSSHIFTRAYTVERTHGNGLGLTIAQELARAMGGRIALSSIPEEATRFTLLLKLEKS